MPTSKNNGSNRRFYEMVFDEEKHLYYVDGKVVPSVTEILNPLHRSYGTVNAFTLELAAMRGTAVHLACQAIDQGDEPDIDDETEGYISAYLDWLNLYEPIWVGVEKRVFCEEGWFAGTLDRVGYIGDDAVIVDIKTSQPTREAYLSVCLQTTAYAMAMASEDGFKRGYLEYKRYGLFLMKDGKYRLLDCQTWEKQNHFSADTVFAVLLKTHKMISRLLETKGKR